MAIALSWVMFPLNENNRGKKNIDTFFRQQQGIQYSYYVHKISYPLRIREASFYKTLEELGSGGTMVTK